MTVFRVVCWQHLGVVNWSGLPMPGLYRVQCEGGYPASPDFPLCPFSRLLLAATLIKLASYDWLSFSRLFGRFPLARGSSYFGAQHDFKPGPRWSPQRLLAPRRQLNCYPQLFHYTGVSRCCCCRCYCCCC